MLKRCVLFCTLWGVLVVLWTLPTFVQSNYGAEKDNGDTGCEELKDSTTRFVGESPRKVRSPKATCGGDVQCNCGDMLTSSQTMWYDLIDCSGDGLYIGADSVVLDGNGHTIDGSGDNEGIYWTDRHNITIKNCIIKEFGYGILLRYTDDSKIINNEIYDCNRGGIWDWEAGNYTVITGNHIHSSRFAINIQDSWNNTISGNDLENSDEGRAVLEIDNSPDVVGGGHNVFANNISGGYGGIALWAWDVEGTMGNNYFHDNNIFGHSEYGILLGAGVHDGTRFSYNDIYNSNMGIRVRDYSTGNVTFDNNRIRNNQYGAYLESGDEGWGGNLFYNNIFTYNVVENAYETGNALGNLWDNSEVGNYWDDFESNPGYPNHYEIPGPGDGIDWHPRTTANRPPYIPADPLPEDSTTEVDIDDDLEWTGGDADSGDIVTYDIYFGETSSPPQVETDWPSESYDPGTLNYETNYYWSIVSRDSQGETTAGPIWYFTTASEYIRGDANVDGIVDVGDVVFLVSYLYRNGPAPDPLWVGDANCDDIINVGDIVYLVSYLYRGGPPPGCP